MEIILMQSVKHLGKLGAKVKVRSGYGRNYLIPRGLALPATAANMEVFEQRRAELEKTAKDQLTQAQARSARFTELRVVVKARVADEEGKLYGSVHAQDIARAATEQGVALDKSEVVLANGPIRKIGEHKVSAHLHADVNLDFTVVVEAEG